MFALVTKLETFISLLHILLLYFNYKQVFLARDTVSRELTRDPHMSDLFDSLYSLRSQEISPLLWAPNVHFVSHKSPLLNHYSVNYSVLIISVGFKCVILQCDKTQGYKIRSQF